MFLLGQAVKNCHVINQEADFNGLSERHLAQIIRRKMLQKVKPSAKAYKRKKSKKDFSI